MSLPLYDNIVWIEWSDKKYFLDSLVTHTVI